MWENLKSAIAKVIKTNGNQEITGQLLQNELIRIVDEVGKNATLAGIATPATDPGIPDGPVFYFATVQGTYPSFGSVKIDSPLAIIYSTENGWASKGLIDFSINLFVFVDSLPVTGEENKIYFVPAEKTEDGNLFDEFIWNNGKWERLGSAKVDLAAYAKTEDVEAALEAKQDTISDLEAIRSGAAKGATALQNESDPVYLADKPSLALKSEIPDISGKVDKVEGKELSSNDYTDKEKAKLAGLQNYDDSEVKGLIAKKANASTTLSGYGITDAYTKTEVDEAIANAITTTLNMEV